NVQIDHDSFPTRRSSDLAALPHGAWERSSGASVASQLLNPNKKVHRGIWGKSELTVREAGKLAVAKHTLYQSLLSPCILLNLPRSEEHTSELQSRENLVC